jgi:hypothetical protein
VLVYATESELGALCEPPESATELLREASRLVRRATILDIYEVDPAGKPTDPNVIEAFRDATCRQAAEWDRNDVDPVAGEAGVEPLETATSIAGASVSYDVSVATLARAKLSTALCAAALDILRDAQLASGAPSRA